MSEKNEKKDSVLYKRTKAAKSAVKSVFEHIDPMNDPEEILSYVYDRFTPDERVVVAAGGFSTGPDGNLQFLMPATSRVIDYFKNGTSRFEKGYAKVTVSNMVTRSDTHCHFSIEKYERFPEGFFDKETEEGETAELNDESPCEESADQDVLN